MRGRPGGRYHNNGFKLISEFFAAVRDVFESDWEGHTPKTSRLIHGAGVQALGYVMELLVARYGAQTRRDFAHGLAILPGHTAWSSGSWRFADFEQLPWNRLENTHQHIMALAQHLVSAVRKHPLRKFKLEHSAVSGRVSEAATAIHPQAPGSLAGELEVAAAHEDVSLKM